MASRSLGHAVHSGSNRFDVPVAALAGLSVAFAAFAAPAELLTELIGSSGLPSILPAAEPPLGLNARIGIGAAGAIIMFAFAFLLLRWLDRFGRRRAEAAEDAEVEREMPRLRRRDFHPDASPRPPLFAGAELGEPELALASEPELVPEPDVEPEAAVLPAPEVQQRLRRAWLPDTPPAAEPDPAIGPETIEAAPEPAAEAAPSPRGNSMSELLERLEQGLAHRRVGPPAAPAAPVAAPAGNGADAPQVFPAQADDRLQSAIDSLQRLASRQD